jgi:flagellar biosynthesis protein FliR
VQSYPQAIAFELALLFASSWLEMNAGLQAYLGQALLVGARVGMLMVFAPFFGSQAIPARIKIGLTLGLTVVLSPVTANRIDAVSVNWVQALLGEAAVGLLIGLAVQFVFEGVQFAGQILGFQLGYSLENIIDPQTQVDTPVLAVFQQTVAILIFLQLGIHRWLLRSLAQSFEYLPPGTIGNIPSAAVGLMQAAGRMMVIGAQMAAPVLVATMLTDVALGFIGKAAPQLPVMLVGISVKHLLGVAILAIVILWWPSQLQGQFERALQLMDHLLHIVH